jgi:hypothetical protein
MVAVAAEAGAEWRISTAGYGPARLGMTVDEAAQALGVDLIAVDPVIFDDSACLYLTPKPDIAGLLIMVSDGIVVRFDVSNGGSIKTRSGLGIGDPEEKVMSVLGPAVAVQPHFYGGLPDHYLTMWSTDHKSAVRFETDKGKVALFYAGLDPQVTFVEGCF